MTVEQQRLHSDVRELARAGFPLRLADDNSFSRFSTFIRGPSDTPYSGGLWEVRVYIPPEYPFKSPSVTFAAGTMLHPNVDQRSGSICLDVISTKWTPMFTLRNVLSAFLPYLLAYPNPSDPLNGSIAALAINDHSAYEKRIKEFVASYMAGSGCPQLSQDEQRVLGGQNADLEGARQLITGETTAKTACKKALSVLAEDASLMADCLCSPAPVVSQLTGIINIGEQEADSDGFDAAFDD